MKKTRLTKHNKITINIISLTLSVLIVAGALVWSENYEPSASTKGTVFSEVTQERLKQSTGKDGNECLVAVDGTVYKIVDSPLWQNGQHTTSNGLAYCGADLTEAMKQSPHGKAKLELLEKVGTLK